MKDSSKEIDVKRKEKNRITIIDNLLSILSNRQTNRAQRLDDDTNNITKIIQSNIDTIYDKTNGDPSKFIFDIYRDNSMNGHSIDTDLFNITQQILQDNQNMFSKYSSIESLVNALYELEEVVNTMRDCIVTQDNITSSVSRILDFIGVDNETKMPKVETIEKMESDHSLLLKIKDHIVPKTLMYGSYYAYTIPYKDIIEYYVNNIRQDYMYNDVTILDHITKESITIGKSDVKGIKIDGVTNEDVCMISENLSFIQSPIPLCCLNGDLNTPMLDIMYNQYVKESGIVGDFDETRQAISQGMKNKKMITDFYKVDNSYSELNISALDLSKSSLNDVYIELIPPTKLIPLKIMKSTLGYFYFYDNELSCAPIDGRPNAMNPNAIISQYQNTYSDNILMDNLVEILISKMDKHFIEKNHKFKEIMLSALQQYDLRHRRIAVQFIPNRYITEFKIDPDENDIGQSMLSGSLVYGKLYWSLLMFSHLAILSRSIDTRVYHVRQSGADTKITNKVNDIMRELKRAQISVQDIMGGPNISNKIGAFRDLVIPTGSGNEKAVEMDILSGQDIRPDDDFLDRLNKSMINSTGFPSTLANHVDEVDYAKSIIMENRKVLDRTVTYQQSLNPCITEWYKKIAKYGGYFTDSESTLLNVFEFKFEQPLDLRTNNINEKLEAINTLVSNMVTIVLGESSLQYDDDTYNRIKEHTIRELMISKMPGLDWDYVKILVKKSEQLVVEEKELATITNAEDSEL